MCGSTTYVLEGNSVKKTKKTGLQTLSENLRILLFFGARFAFEVLLKRSKLAEANPHQDALEASTGLGGCLTNGSGLPRFNIVEAASAA